MRTKEVESASEKLIGAEASGEGFPSRRSGVRCLSENQEAEQMTPPRATDRFKAMNDLFPFGCIAPLVGPHSEEGQGFPEGGHLRLEMVQ